MGKINSLLIPNISTLSSDKHKSAESENTLKAGEKSEFKGLIDQKLNEPRIPHLNHLDKGSEVHVSQHALKRLRERNIQLDNQEFMKIKDAIGKLKNKGGKDSLVITSKAAYVIDVKKNTVVTAVDKNQMNDNVFTKIDSTIFMN